MTRDQLAIAINNEVQKYLGFKTELGGMTGRTKKEREIALAKLIRMNKMVAEASAVKVKYTFEQWNAAIIFGVGETGVSERDLAYVNLRLKVANNLWLSDLWTE